MHRDGTVDHGLAVLATAAKTIGVMGKTWTQDDTIETIAIATFTVDNK